MNLRYGSPGFSSPWRRRRIQSQSPGLSPDAVHFGADKKYCYLEEESEQQRVTRLELHGDYRPNPKVRPPDRIRLGV
jgi:hypothetical protein